MRVVVVTLLMETTPSREYCWRSLWWPR